MATQEKIERNIILHPCGDRNVILYPKTKVENVIGYFSSLERLDNYLYRVTFDTIPAYEELTFPIGGGCSSFVNNGKLYRNLDWNYDNTAEFVVRCKNFEGIGFISGMNDSELDYKKIGQLPYHLVDGRNNDGIMVSTHILINDWNFNGSGNKDVSITSIPFHILNELHSISDINTVLNPYLLNIKIPDALKEMGYLIQYLVTDGTTTYAILPPTTASGTYSCVNITANPKLTNFRWVNRATVVRTETDIQDHPTGIERWNSISNDISLEDLRFTKAYESPTRLSEFIGINHTTKESSDAELTAIYNTAHSKYQTRTRNGELWQTVHSVIYSPNKMESLYVQENYKRDLAANTVVYSHHWTMDFPIGTIPQIPSTIHLEFNAISNNPKPYTKLGDLEGDGYIISAFGQTLIGTSMVVFEANLVYQGNILMQIYDIGGLLNPGTPGIYPAIIQGQFDTWINDSVQKI